MASGTRLAGLSRAARETAALVEAARPKTAAAKIPKPPKGKGARKPAAPVK